MDMIHPAAAPSNGKRRSARRTHKTNLDSLLRELRQKGWTPGLTRESYQGIIETGLRGKNLALASVTTEIVHDEQPITVRGTLYRVVCAGWLPSTDAQHYNRVKRLTGVLRELGIIPFRWLVDNVRANLKPSSWSGLADFMDTVQRAYRKDFWAGLPDYVHVFVEKDAISGVISPVTKEFDVTLSPIRGYCSISFAHEIAEIWSRIEKPIHAYYMGDFDASGFDLERDLKAKLARYCTRSFTWTRLGVNDDDFETFKLLPLKAKKSDRRYKKFIQEHGTKCAELDAIPPTELRRRVQEAIESHIPQAEWKRLQAVEKVERESLEKVILKFGKVKAG